MVMQHVLRLGLRPGEVRERVPTPRQVENAKLAWFVPVSPGRRGRGRKDGEGKRLARMSCIPRGVHRSGGGRCETARTIRA